MGRRLVLSTLSVVVVVVFLLGVPLGVAMRNGIQSSAADSLRAEAQRLLNTVEVRTARGEQVDQESLQRQVSQDRSATVVLTGGQTILLGAPAPDEGNPLRVELTGEQGEQVVVLESRARVTRQVHKAWLLILIEAFFAVATAGALAALQARSLARPLVDLAEAAERFGSGDPRRRRHRRSYGLPEVDRVADVLERRAERISRILAAERQFAANASHQLRTPLTALSMRLEEITMSDDMDAMRDEATVALSQVERLTEVVSQLLAQNRTPMAVSGDSIDIDKIVSQQLDEWSVAFSKANRGLQLVGVPNLTARANPASVSQILATLVENALAHGGGTVTIRTRTVGGSVVLEVTDEGGGVNDALGHRIFEAGVSGGESTGRGLALARDLARADGARLELVQQRPAVFALFLAAPDEVIG
ncbi:ATP-binding protein [Sporichthya sp.]|uniref:ATP-binding protein n=1 Tax=Sporichthya sp. TaxID=65475 RepID=UPI001807DE3C|nr:ATP-binding protein [Sporichthya sp.]MBA3744850.1 HAMP domain-containing histidine kinase [Sporichthya sp.]